MNDREELEALDQALDALVGRGPRSLEELLVTFPNQSELVRQVQSVEKTYAVFATSVLPETKAKHVAALMEAARNTSPQIVVLPSKSRLRRVLRPIAVLAIVASLALMPTVALAQTSQPGEALYGTKLAFENLQVLVATDSEDDARLHLLFASRRLEELSVVVAEGRSDEIRHVMSNFHSHAAGAEGEIDELAAAGEAVSELSADLAAVLRKHVIVLKGLADNAECVEGDEEAGDSQCKGLLHAIENSSKVLDRHPGLGSQQSNGKSSEHGKPDDPGKPTDTGKPTGLPSQDSTPTEPGPPAGAGRP